MAGNRQKQMFEFVEKLNDLIPNAAITVNDLIQPQASVFQRICVGFLEQLGATPSNVLECQSNQMPKISYFDMFSNTLVFVNLYHCINYILHKIGVNDFTFIDLIEPNPKKIYNILYVMVDFLDYCDGKILNGSEELNNIKLMKNTTDELQKKVDSVQNEINENATNRVTRSQEKKNLKEYLNKNKQILEVLMQDKENANKVKMDKEHELEELKCKDKNVRKQLMSLQDEIEKLNANIISSPQKHEERFSQMVKEKEESQKELKTSKGAIGEIQKSYHYLDSKSKEQELIQNLLKEILDKKKSLDKNMLDYEADVSVLNELKDSFQEYERAFAELQEKEKSVQSMKEEEQKDKQTHDTYKKKMLKNIEKKYQEVCSIIKDKKIVRDNLQMRINEMEEALKNDKMNHETTREFFYSCSKTLSEKFESLLNNFLKLGKIYEENSKL